MKLCELHVCPVWEEADGSRSIGMEERNPHPPVVGWACVGVFNIAGRREELVMAW